MFDQGFEERPTSHILKNPDVEQEEQWHQEEQ